MIDVFFELIYKFISWLFSANVINYHGITLSWGQVCLSMIACTCIINLLVPWSGGDDDD